jgi:hypothetical protein
VLNHFIVFGEAHLRKILDDWLTYYHRHRPHQGLGNVPIHGVLAPEISIEDLSKVDFICHETLGGLLKHYERRAA